MKHKLLKEDKNKTNKLIKFLETKGISTLLLKSTALKYTFYLYIINKYSSY